MKDKRLDTGQVSRRDFLKYGGLAAAGGAVTLGAGTLVGCAEEAVAASVEVETLYTCPIDGKRFASYDAMREHFEQNHPQDAIPEVMPLTVNGAVLQVQVEPQWTLQEALQHALGLTGAKTMCDRGGCGSCTVLIDGVPALSCTMLAIECEGRAIETIEGIAAEEKWQPLFDAFANHDGMQCGYCSPGQIVMAKYVIDKYGSPTDEQIVNEMAGNICRCGTYQRHPLAIQEAVRVMGGGSQ
ncbi:MAG: (2Fe-2S)-binding protein [Coriobacteriales bacterium]|jgi:xanthine dehydrogenase YagT iron-sulfur-binding subunit|nr:(2Fe-2S)-binding protein [Coriobacteriales bacterium]